MIIVADTSPLCYLYLIQRIELLPQLYGEVLIPPAVADELAAADQLPALAAWIEQPPAWLKITSPQSIDPTLNVHLGEAAAICLALERRADRLLIDERTGREAAEVRGLYVTGTLGVLDLAARSGFLDLEAAIADLRQTNFHISETIIERLIERFQQWRSSQKES